MSDIRTLICLRGGLGNQLFQFSYANRIARGNPLEFVVDIGQPNKTRDGTPELFDLLHPSEYDYCVNIESFILSKILNYSLRKKSKSAVSLFVTGLEVLGSLILLGKFGRMIKINTGKGLGYFDDVKDRSGNLLNGYFQSYKWTDIRSIKSKILSIDSGDQRFQLYLNESKNQKVLAIHIRLGDYKLFKEFGVLPRSYYEDSIAEMAKLVDFNRIWLFSNDINLARDFIPDRYAHLVSEIPSDFTSVETLQIMRLAQSYIIGNSTFSWWGATLSITDEAPVIAPTPWFDNMDEPVDLISPRWKRIDR